MTGKTGSYLHGESGLSEVIGFVLILGLIVAACSLYLTYSVPAQGRENEINQMNTVRDQFVTYKISLDSLFTNTRIGTTMSSSFTLGTGGDYTQGSQGFLPIMNPVRSSAVLVINERTSQDETLSLTSQSLMLNTTVPRADDFSSTPEVISSSPDHIYINISNVQPGDLSHARFYGIQVNSSTWYVTVNLTPRTSYYVSYSSVPKPVWGCDPPLVDIGSGTVCLQPSSAYNYDRSDLTLNVVKGSVGTMQDYTVYRNVSSGNLYSIDLMDDAYGLNSIVSISDIISMNVFNPQGSGIRATGTVTYGSGEMTYGPAPLPLGSLEYRAQNNYWIPQTYYYQMGGVFLSQSDGVVTYKLPPEITFSYDNTSKVTSVDVNALVFDPGNRGAVGGNSPVQIKTTLTSVTPLPFAPGDEANTRWIRIGVNTSDLKAGAMWLNYFNYTAASAGVPNFTTGIAGNTSYILINGYDATLSTYDINVRATNATYTLTVRGMGGIVL